MIKTIDQIYDTLIQYRTGDMYCPKIANLEALAMEVDHVADCINGEDNPVADGHAGWMVTRILEAAQESIKSRGKEIKI